MEEVSDPNVLVMGVNPGPTRTAIGKSILGIDFALLMFTLFGGEEFLFEAIVMLVIGYGVTSGQQYVLDRTEGVLKKRFLMFLRPTDWKILGQLSNLSHAKRRKSSSDDEGLNSEIHFYFKDGTEHKWNLFYGDSMYYSNQINDFLKSSEEQEVVTSNPFTASKPKASREVQVSNAPLSKPVPESTNVWGQPIQSASSSSASASVWDAYESEDKTLQ